MAVITDTAGAAITDTAGAEILDTGPGGGAVSGKQSGLGSRFLVGGYDVSGDVSALSSIASSLAPLDVTGIDKGAHERIAGLRDGSMAFASFWNVSNSVPVLASLPKTDTLMAFIPPPQALGGPSAWLQALQVSYNPTRGNDGALTMATEGQGDGWGLEWCELLTAGLRTDTAATNGTSVDGGAASSYGAGAYLQLTGFTGTSVTVTVQHSADNATWSTLAAFTAVTAAPAWQRSRAAGTVNRYLRVITSGTFTRAVFAAAVIRYPAAAGA